ncbi:MAG: hypothetical protein NTW19_09805 [Planctomycetota bacterium]|nr:hypothetical protein [Planctomycetota bacterium]
MRDGSVAWTTIVGNLNRPILLRDSLLAGNVLRDLATGLPLEKKDPKSGKDLPWTVYNGAACGTPSACDNTVFWRAGSTGWRDIRDGTLSQFLGVRAGCFINILPVGGVVVEPEASSGCNCSYGYGYSLKCSVAYSPAPPAKRVVPTMP